MPEPVPPPPAPPPAGAAPEVPYCPLCDEYGHAVGRVLVGGVERQDDADD